MDSSTLIGNNDLFRIAFKLFGLDVYWYGIFSALGYFIAILIFLFVTAKRYKLNYEVPFYYIFFAIPMILLGARLWSVIIGDASITQFFNFREGGLAIQGGVIFGVITALIYFPLILRLPKYHLRVVQDNNVYIRRPSILIFADAIVPTILIGQAIGRWGNFFNGEIFGQAIDASQLEWLKNLMPGVFNHMTPAVGLIVNGVSHGEQYFQPLFLYESFLNIVTFTIIYGAFAEIKWFKVGTIASLYFIDYGIIRFIMEPLRNSSFTFAGTYVINSLFLIGGLIAFIYYQFLSPKLRQFKLWKFIKDKITYTFNKQTISTNPKINDQKYIRKDSEIIYFANR
ncbi:MAG: prolipoprotein diacylglyceryl transferase [Ureaplasma sp.]|nr:prolipoprotein diacylglyceryl transferase [Ureaplasma sp.]MDE7221987.1 prolipoprotein diacylglyceryl transferase [Ureaplasma sp.]